MCVALSATLPVCIMLQVSSGDWLSAGCSVELIGSSLQMSNLRGWLLRALLSLLPATLFLCEMCVKRTFKLLLVVHGSFKEGRLIFLCCARVSPFVFCYFSYHFTYCLLMFIRQLCVPLLSFELLLCANILNSSVSFS